MKRGGGLICSFFMQFSGICIAWHGMDGVGIKARALYISDLFKINRLAEVLEEVLGSHLAAQLGFISKSTMPRLHTSGYSLLFFYS